MENWREAFEALAKRLRNQRNTDTGSENRPATPEQVEEFREALEADLEVKGKSMRIGDKLTYHFYVGRLLGSETAANVQGGNEHFERVISKMKKSDDWNYCFLSETYVTFEKVSDNGDLNDLVPTKSSF